MKTLEKFQDKHVMTTALAVTIAQRLQNALDVNGVASLVVSGGSTPKLLFEQLSQQPLAWHKVSISLCDERWVDPDSPDSNEFLVRNTLLVDQAAEAQFVPLKTRHDTPEAGQSMLQQNLENMPSPFDIVLLGMGEDGHTASLFPSAENLNKALDMNSGLQCTALTPAELPSHAPYPRMTMTLPRLLNSQWLVLLLTGASKMEVYEQALAGDDYNEMPVRAVLKQTQTPITTYWAP